MALEELRYLAVKGLEAARSSGDPAERKRLAREAMAHAEAYLERRALVRDMMR